MRDTTFEDTKTFSKAVAGIMQKHYPDLVTAKMAKQERIARVFINWSQNDASKTMISVYSLRGREKPFVSFPLAWSDLEDLPPGRAIRNSCRSSPRKLFAGRKERAIFSRRCW